MSAKVTLMAKKRGTNRYFHTSNHNLIAVQREKKNKKQKQKQKQKQNKTKKTMPKFSWPYCMN